MRETMKSNSMKQGSMMLLVVILMSILLVLCTRMWRTTAYVVDISLQKQLHMQKKWALKGILTCGIEAAKTDFNALAEQINEHGSITLLLNSYSFDIPHLAQAMYFLVFTLVDKTTMQVTAQQREGEKIMMQTSLYVFNSAVVA